MPTFNNCEHFSARRLCLLKTKSAMKKFTFILVLFCTHQFNVKANAQGITLSLKNARLETAFSEIQKQSGYKFVFSWTELEKSKPVTVKITNGTIASVLDAVLKDQPLTYQIIPEGNNIVIKKKNPAKDNDSLSGAKTPLTEVNGKVLNEKEEPIAGASVKVKGTNIGTSTDIEGFFSLKVVNENSTITISSVGFETQAIQLAGRNTLSVQLKIKANQLDDVVISTGYQQVPKERATGSFAFIDNKTLNQQMGTNILERLNGVSSGVLFDVGKDNARNPQSQTNIAIRGLSTINGPLDPLIVLNGFIYEGDIKNINPNDVDNVTILKDASATSIWGARAGNGVIVITTKKGKFNQKMQVDIRVNMIGTRKPDLSNIPQMSSIDYIDVEEFLFNKGYFENRINIEHSSLTPAVEILLKRRNGEISASDSAQQINELKSIDTRDQYRKYVYKAPLVQQYNVNLRGGASNTAYLFSVGYDRTNNELREKYNKLNLRFEQSVRPIKNVQLNLEGYYTNSKAYSGIPGYNTVFPGNRKVPYFSLADDQGKARPVSTLYRSSFVDTAGGGMLLDWKYYPLEDYKHNKTSSNIQEFFANIGIQYKIASFITLDLKYQFQKQQSKIDQLLGIESFGARNLINLFSIIDRSSNTIKYNVPLGGVRSITNSAIQSQTARAQININRNWGENNISALIGGEARESKSFGESFTSYGYNSDPLASANVDYVNPYPVYTGGSQLIPGTPSFNEKTYRFISIYANAAYTLKEKYIISGSIRRDGSNVFGVNTNDKWKPLWSIGGSWRISNEAMYTSKLIPTLNFRLTYGVSGNVDASRSALPIAQHFNASGLTNLPYARVNSINNPELKWEQSRQLNFGLDFSFKNQIVSGSIEYYIKKGVDLYGQTIFDYTSWGGADQIFKNVANMKGEGMDIMLQSKNIDKTFKWGTTFLLNYNVAKTTKYLNKLSEKISSIIGGGKSIVPVVGKPLYGIAAYRWAGLDNNGNPQGIIGGDKSTDYATILNGSYTKGLESGSIVFIGSGSPTFFGSLINTFSFRQLSVSFNISYKLKYYFIKPSISYYSLVTDGIGHKEYSERWKNPGDELTTNVPSFVYPSNANRDAFYRNSEVNVLKGDHIRLQYINLSYSFGDTHKTSPFKEIQLDLNFSNLGILWRANDQRLDPDYPGSIVPSLSCGIGLRASF